MHIPRVVAEAVSSQSRVEGAPHDFYRYPARFSPVFAREVIRAFSREGDLVIDPFCGGGTTLLEAMALGRRVAGMDVSALATFIARTKTTPLSVHDKRAIVAWLESLERDEPQIRAKVSCRAPSDVAHYERNLPHTAKVFFSWTLHRIARLEKPRQQSFARLALLAVGQWALDCRTSMPSTADMKDEFCRRLRDSIEAYFRFLTGVAEDNELPRCRLSSLRRIINRDAQGSDEDGRIPRSWLPAKLVVTSPPYPGVHVVYHRWQINGRRETPAPFWLANQRDGAGEAHYVLGRRSEPELKTYFARLTAVFTSLRPLLSPDALVVQLVAFSNSDWQLEAYVEAMQTAGYHELAVDCDWEFVTGGRIWRQVPGRKWYANKQGKIAASKEVLLLHRP